MDTCVIKVYQLLHQSYICNVYQTVMPGVMYHISESGRGVDLRVQPVAPDEDRICWLLMFGVTLNSLSLELRRLACTEPVVWCVDDFLSASHCLLLQAPQVSFFIEWQVNSSVNSFYTSTHSTFLSSLCFRVFVVSTCWYLVGPGVSDVVRWLVKWLYYHHTK